MDKQQAVEAAARGAIAHSDPNVATDPDQVLNAIEAARAAGATTDDIAAEMLRQRDK